MNFVDLCCGGGALSAGLIQAGLTGVLGVDTWDLALRVYRRNLRVPTLRCDIRRLQAFDLPRVDAVVGGPPCQDHSPAGNGVHGERSRLTLEFTFAAVRLGAKYICYENVPQAKSALAYAMGLDYLRCKGYGINEVVLDASYYGVGQSRRRLLLVGQLGGEDDALHPLLEAGKAAEPLTLRRHFDSLGVRLGVDHLYRHPRGPGARGVFSVDEPYPTVTVDAHGRQKFWPGYRPRHGDTATDRRLIRCLTAAEGALVQGFPRDWDWCGATIQERWKMIGNAVPVPLGAHLGRVLLAASRGHIPPPRGTDKCQLIRGDCRQVLRQVPPGSVRCCVTSPPYWGLRDYEAGEGEIGKEPTLDGYVSGLVQLFRLVREALADDGTLWLVIGDSYAGSCGSPVNRDGYLPPAKVPPCGVPAKNLIGVPWRVARALQEDGWILRADIIWHKVNGRPESVRDRPTRTHEYVFLFAKQPSYFFDAEAVREPLAAATIARRRYAPGPQVQKHGKPDGRNKRTVWDIPVTHPVGSHTAPFPEELAETCILAGSERGDLVLDLFTGSGSSGAAALRLGRRFLGIELSERFCEEARVRLERAAGVGRTG